MKKLLVLTLVLALASVASAALTTTVLVNGSAFNMATGTAAVGDTVTVKVGNDVASAGGTTSLSMNADAAESGTIALLGTWMLPGTGSAASADGSGGIDFDWADGTIGLNVTGDWCQAVFDIPAATSEVVLSFSGTMFDATPTGGTITVPEPMTIALLGLGGLFLRRRK